MKRLLVHFIFILLLFYCYSCKKTPEQILEKTLKRIDKIKTVEQILLTEYYDSANSFFKTDTSAYFFNFIHPWKISGSKYYCSGYYLSEKKPIEKYIYDIVPIDTIGYGSIHYRPKKDTMYRPIFGSLDALRRCLPTVLLDSTVQITRLNDTIIDEQKHHHIRYKLTNKYFQPGGSLKSIFAPTDHYYSVYDLIINKRNLLPQKVIKKNYHQHEIGIGWAATTLWYNFNPQRPAKVWDITLNPQNYIYSTRDEHKEARAERVKVHFLNKKAPYWELPSLYTNQIYSLNDFENKLLLIEFWFVGCGGCHVAIPFLNRVKNQYDSEEFDVIGINFVYEEKNVLENYVRESNMKFLVLNDGQQTAISYEVRGAPLFLLIKDGIIIYAAEGYSKKTEAKILEEIEKYLILAHNKPANSI